MASSETSVESNPNHTATTIIIIGAGHAGLAMSRCLLPPSPQIAGLVSRE
jgi:cation diffusion facilitator CzcD-associated flavoprotein CzcO